MEDSEKKLPNIRKATIKDVEELRNIYFEFMQGVAELDPFYKQDAEHWHSEESLHDIIKDLIKKNRRLFLLEIDGKAVGFIDIRIKKREEVYKIRKTGHIESIYIKPELRGKGYSKLLIEKATEWFKSKGLENFTVGTYAPDKKAREFWEKQGFKEYFVLYHK